MKGIDEKVDKVLEAVDGTKTTQHHKMRHTKKLLGLPIGTAMLYIGAIMVGAALVSLLFGTYYGVMTGDVELNGIEQPTNGLKFDTTNLLSETTSIPMDITTLSAGDSESVAHTISCTDGVWEITFDSENIYTNPTDPFYGFYFDILQGGVSILGDSIIVNPTTPQTITFSYALDPMFAITLNDMTFDLTVTVTAPEGPEANPDSNTGYHGGSHSFPVYVLANDIDHAAGGLTITDAHMTSPSGGSCSIQGTFPNQYVVCSMDGSADPLTFEYTIQDSNGNIASSTITTYWD